MTGGASGGGVEEMEAGANDSGDLEGDLEEEPMMEAEGVCRGIIRCRNGSSQS